MGKTPDDIRAEIERTRSDLRSDVDLLADKVTPTRVLGRRVSAARDGVVGVRERVMGQTQSAVARAKDRVADSDLDVSGTLAGAPDRLRSQTAGSPILAGAVAFGLGFLASSLIPVSEAERDAAASAQDRLGDAVETVKDEATQVAREVKDRMQEPVRDATESVKSAASDAATAVKEQAADSGSTVTEQAKQAGSEVRDQVQTSTSTVTDEAKSAAQDVRDQAKSKSQEVRDTAGSATSGWSDPNG